MNTLVVLFNLRADADASAYEQWARQTDLPVVRKLDGVSRFDIYRSEGLFGTDQPAPYQYIEVIDIDSMAGFLPQLDTDTMRRVAGEFRQFADNPVFILTQRIS